MADGSCGPSNAFKGLAGHLEQDRSRHQDRVAPGPQHQPQGFRSTPLNSGRPDQFDAFQRQQAQLPLHPRGVWQPEPPSVNFEMRPAQAAGFFPQQPAQQHSPFTPNTAASWVNDFGSMSFAESRSHERHPQSIHGPFMGQPSIAGPMHPSLMAQQHQTFAPFQSPAMGLHSINHHPGGLQAYNGALKDHNGAKSDFPIAETATSALEFHRKSLLDAHRESMLEQEFEDAMNEWMLQNGPEAEISDENEFTVEDNDNLETSLDATSTTPATQDQDPSEISSAENRDELSRAAQQLVDSLADNNSEKFKNSDFLALMRRIASQELTVQGNDLVETQTDSYSTPQTTTQTSAAPPTTANEPNLSAS